MLSFSSRIRSFTLCRIMEFPEKLAKFPQIIAVNGESIAQTHWHSFLHVVKKALK